MSLKTQQSKTLSGDNVENAEFTLRPVAKWVRTAIIASVATTSAFSLHAQEANVTEEDQADVEVIDVVGTRKTIQDQIAIKRESTTVVDGLSSEDIGELPALSIGEALESITGAASHRENGGATEITIRGLGPFLSATHINGREATNGSGDRSVNFSQFPSELVKKVAIYKTQDASMIEGGVAGVISLETVQPLDYGKQRIQGEVKTNYNPDEGNVDNSLQGDLGFRGTFSYVDQFEFDNGQALGISFGLQRQDISQPEAEYRSSSPTGSSLWACLNDPTNTNEGFYRSSAGDCEDQVSGSSNQGYNTAIDPETGKAVSDGTPYAWTGSSRSYRQNETSDERDALFLALQFQPSESWDINFDAQVSDRTQQESRHDLIFLQKRAIPGLTGPTLVTNDVGGILHWEGQDRIESSGEQFSREENYRGYGLNIEHYATDALTVKLDLAYSKTSREELQISNRARTADRQSFSWDMGEYIPHFTVTDFDVTDISNYTDSLRTRIDRENTRDNEIKSARLDFEYALSGDVFTSVQAGLRTSELSFIQYGGSQGNGSRNEFTLDTANADALELLQSCQKDFPESDFLDGVSDGDLITNVDSDGNVIGGGSSWATYDNVCFSQAVVASQNGEFGYPDVEYENSGTIDVTEKTNSAYVMASYDTEMFNKYIRGNFGVRIVDTEVTSVGFRNSFDVVTDELGVISLVSGDSLERIEGGGDYTEVLPSFNLVVDYSDDILIRGGIYRGMSRADPSDLGYSRTFQTDDDLAPTSLADLLVGVNGSGNPDTQPLMSWNYDVAFEWYPNEDSIFAFGLYYKQFQGGFQQRTVLENFVIDGQEFALPVTNSVTTDDESDIFGLEASIAYRWDNGIGVKIGYNYADTDFEFEDSLYGDTFITDVDGNTTQLTAGIVDPASVPGFSEHVFSTQVYYQIGDLDTAIIYKYRSEYFQPYTSNGTRLRYVDEVGVWEARMSYKVNEHVRVKLEAINLFSAPKSQDYYVQGNLGEVNDYGPRLFAGVSLKY
ncbi:MULTISPECIES: TonB-dependent receptor [Alteromonas]|jgi:iron complex outermembrane receptor protein|uniref:TonB-dependent receptor n=1 Tax=Alteromonas stellipolaris TaxID=233316 RepID=A0AAW7Z7A7_9ALTE|nr:MULTISPECIES: TonB-dependent receptor [Alteromonas]AMJ91900.1 TonB-dependent receptor [Alteromonas sp. Mac2]ALM89233.1 TonB-dependent receptor [Alteromonas stellipolaris LMG 21856]AMJ75613.1 TonB-dependent receptor [Alteromonas stellipolaris]AMJ88037.1 TonB-dependent receptor [Alteromonas sp. Mac1]AMJ95715.1 TonB-dependent receptor [Alteromonas stellipolaris]